MSNTTHLHLVGPDETARVTLSDSAERDTDQAQLFLLSLDNEMITADGPRTAYLLGLAEGHLANLLEIIRGLRGAP